MAEVQLKDAPQGVRTYYEKGIAAMERSNLDYAMDMFAAALHLEPRLLQIRKLLRAAAVQKHKTDPPKKRARYKNAGSLLKASGLVKKNPLRALETVEILIRSDPFNIKYVKVLCDAAVAAELPEVATQSLEILRDHRPNDLAVLEPLAALYHDLNEYRSEYECRSRITRLKPNDSEALKKLKDAAAHNTMEKAGWDTADSYRDVIRESPETKPVSEKSELETCIEKVACEPDNINYRRTLAELYLRERQFDDAILVLETCIKKSNGPDSQLAQALADARNRKAAHDIEQAEEAGDIHYAGKLRKKLKATQIEDAAEQVRHYPSDLLLKFDYGKVLFENGRFTEAIQQFQLAQRNPNRRVKALYYLGCAFKEKGQYDIALDHLETACSELPVLDDVKKEILYELGSLCETMGNTERAIQAFKEIYTVDIGFRDVAVKIEQTYRK
jgi:tetratricopeptide (TPR) repeat protein